ncbi:hypothetical protein [Enterococcus faecalis]|uniref:hypothetical protein n=1 Tax=Enterococcus faecalis TaxID=1351 RepID=UPI0025B1FC3A|nr:hypothetical protein [Enterococcus faecalis]
MSLLFTILFFILALAVLIYGIIKNKKVLFPFLALSILGVCFFVNFVTDVLDFDDDIVFEKELDFDD